jgi:uncharacterized membrane protein
VKKFYSARGAFRGLKIGLFILVGWLGWLSGYTHGLMNGLVVDVSAMTSEIGSVRKSNVMSTPGICTGCMEGETVFIVKPMREAL